MYENEKMYQLALTLLKGVGPVNAKNLVNCLDFSDDIDIFVQRRDMDDIEKSMSSLKTKKLLKTNERNLKKPKKRFYFAKKKILLPYFIPMQLFPNACMNA